MANQELFDFIRQEILKNIPIEDVKKSLMSAGWPENEISNAINLVNQGAPMSSSGAVSQDAKPMEKIGKFRASYLLVTESFELLIKDKEIMLFPILSTLFSFLIIGSLALFFYTTLFLSGADIKIIENPQGGMMVIHYVFIFLTYFASIFIATFFNAGIVTIVHARINGQDLSFGDGVKNSFKNIGKIFVWSLISSTVGIVLRIIFDRSKLLGKIIIAILGATWGVITFFIVPVLILENKSPFASIKESAVAFKRTWGETLIMNFSMGLFFGIIIIALFILYFASWFTMNFYIIAAASVVFIASLVIVSVISSTLNTIFKVVLYEYAKYGKVPDGFTLGLILGSIKKKN